MQVKHRQRSGMALSPWGVRAAPVFVRIAPEERTESDSEVISGSDRMAERNNSLSTDGASPRRDVSLFDKVEFLSRPQAYRDCPMSVEAVETHMSWVFLTELFAHKLKKPVRYDFLDFRTLEARRHFCEEEVRLNRRLAPDIYVTAVPLAVDPHGELILDEPGEAVDWLVRMKRLPADRMLDRAILARTVDPDDVQGLTVLLADFFGTAVPVAIPPSEYRRRIANAITAQRRVLLKAEYGLSGGVVETVTGQLRKMLMGNAPVFDRRVRRGRIVEGHGDLRPEHVFLGPAPAVIDCLEFNRDFRVQDWLDELSFLAMECDMLGAPEIGETILQGVCARLRDEPRHDLVLFYKAFRALLRAKLAILHLQDADVADPGRWRARAEDYVQLAGRYAVGLG